MDTEHIFMCPILSSTYYGETLYKNKDNSWILEKKTWNYHDDSEEEYEQMSPEKVYMILKYRKVCCENQLAYDENVPLRGPIWYGLDWYIEQIRQIENELKLLEESLAVIPNDNHPKHKICESGKLKIVHISTKEITWNTGKGINYIYDITDCDIMLLIDKIINISTKHDCILERTYLCEESEKYATEWGELNISNYLEKKDILKILNNIGVIGLHIFLENEKMHIAIKTSENILEVDMKQNIKHREIFENILEEALSNNDV